MFCHAPFESLKDAALARKAGRLLDLEAAAALGAQVVEGLVPGDVGQHIVGAGAGGQDEAFVLGAFLDQRADFVLEIKVLVVADDDEVCRSTYL